MTTLPDGTESEPPPSRTLSFFRRLLRKPSPTGFAPAGQLSRHHEPGLSDPLRAPAAAAAAAAAAGQTARHVITGLPRAQTFKRQQSEQRIHLAPVAPSADERRAASVDRRSRSRYKRAVSQLGPNPRVSAPGFLGPSHDGNSPRFSHPQPTAAAAVAAAAQHVSAAPSADPDALVVDQGNGGDGTVPESDVPLDAQSMTTSQHEAMINDELESKWILNLSMHFRDRSKREKFFVTYREKEHIWRRVTISLDYRYATPNSLEMDLFQTRYQRDKSAKVYEAIRESLADIKFYDTVTNLKLETTDGRLHVHVVEDGNEVINYPRVSQVRHLGCRRVRERDIIFDAHMSGFVYKVNVHGHVLIKKEIPSQDTIEEFLYEVNALSSLRYSHDVVRLYGVVVDEHDEFVKGLLIGYASQGALIDIIYDHCKENSHGLGWATRERWARQIVRGLADIHDSGFVQGDFTLSNIVIDDADDAKIIDINRRGCPVGWEPPETTALIEAGHRITMYIGVKSDLYQLGMVLWGLAMEEDEPEAHGRPLMLGPEINVPDWYRHMTEICLSADPRLRLQASTLLQMFPPSTDGDEQTYGQALAISVDDGRSLNEYLVERGYGAGGRPLARAAEPPSDFPYSGRTYVDTSPVPYEHYYPVRGRSPPSPLPSDLDMCESSRGPISKTSWAANRSVRPSYTDVGADETIPDDVSQQEQEQEHSTPTPIAEDGGAASGLGQVRPQKWQSGTAGYTVTGAPANGPASSEAAADVASPHDRSGAVQGEPGSTGDEVASKPCPARTGTAVDSAAQALPPHADDAADAADVVLAPGDGQLRDVELGRSAGPLSHCITPRAGAAELLAKKAGRGGQSHSKVSVWGCDDASERLTTTTTTTNGAMLGPRHESMPAAEAASGRPDLEDAEATRMLSPGPARATVHAAEGKVGAGTDERHSDWAAGAGPPAYGGLVARVPGPTTGARLKADYIRQTSLPESLTGIGAAHMGIDDALMREQGLIDDDLDTMVRSKTVPAALMITTDSRS